MDLNYNLNANLNTSGGYSAMPSQQSNAGTSMWIGSYPSQQQLQQLSGQMANVNMADTGTNYLDAYMAISQQNGIGVSANTPNRDFYVTSVQQAPPGGINTTIANSNNYADLQAAARLANQPLSPTLDFEMAQVGMMTTEQQLALLSELQRKNAAAGLISPPFSPPAYPNNQQPQMPKQYVVTSNISAGSVPISPSYTESGSAPQTPTSERFETSVPAKSSSPESTGSNLHQRSFTISETSSTTSSTSVPGSPTCGMSSVHDDVIDSPRLTRSPSTPHRPIKTTHVPIRSKSLKFDVKFPQDKCHKCLKKVYKVESVGPVKGAVYHNTCFTCKACKTKLTLKNYCLNQNDKYDVSVYCKSHQPTITDKGSHLDANSILIKGAMSVPKLDKVNEQIKVNKNSKYHMDANSLDISHARNVPATDLQTGNKVKAKAWKKQDRTLDIVPPRDVIRHCDVVPEYDVDEYEHALVEQQPDYHGARY
ncbi:LIM domain-containing protein jub-like [Ylistrum balloti]|uniref:LIM domain-containing protein jub-like n=1 Tax=Ylistrum balloti TaxID=509963 RepID=UPI002905E56D|nr:LIM domain-containing protein jub-like [Ylistrum balloti]